MADANPTLLKLNDDLDVILEEHGIDRNRTIICTCGTGREATNEFILFKWLYLYQGSGSMRDRSPSGPRIRITRL